MDDSKRKRETSSNSSTSSHLVNQKKAKEDHSDFSYQTDNSVFITPNPNPNMASSAAPDIASIQEELSSPNAHESRSGGSMNTSKVSSEASLSSSRDSDEDSVITSAAELYMRLPEAKQVVRDMLRINTDTFQQSIDNSVKSAIGNEISKLQNSVKQDVYAAVKHDMDNVNDARYHDVCTQLAELRSRYDNLEQNFDREVLFVKKKAIENDQYARRYTIRIRGVTEYQGEDLKNTIGSIIFYQLRINFQLSDIEIAHRIGQYQRGKTRAILCRFKDRGLKYDIMLQRKNLKGTGVFFDEYNCPEYDDIINEMRSHRFIEKVWAWNGKVMAIDKKGNRHTLRYGINWSAFFDDLEARSAHAQRGPPSSQSSNLHTGPPPPPPPPPPPQSPPASTAPVNVTTSAPGIIAASPALPANTVPGTVTTTVSVINTPPVSTSTTSTAAPTVTPANTRPIPAVIPLKLSTQYDSTAGASGGAAATLNGGATSMMGSDTVATSTPVRPPLQLPLKDIGQMYSRGARSAGALSTPPHLTRRPRFPGSPQMTLTPRPSKTALDKFTLSPLTRTRRTPDIASYFPKT